MTGTGLRVAGVSVRIGSTHVLQDVTFSAPAGSLTAIVGPNGAGKSTVLRLLAGALSAEHGRLSFDDVDLPTLSRRERARRVALLEQHSSTDQELTAADVVGLGRVPHLGVWSGMRPRDRQIADEAMVQAGATHLADRSYHALSGGEQQRVRLAAALAQQPQLLLVDEPTNHLDIGAQLDALALLRGLADSGLTVVTALHDLTHALGHADHLVAMDDGRVRAQGPPADVLSPGLIHELYGVHADVMTHPVSGAPVLAFSRLPDDPQDKTSGEPLPQLRSADASGP